MFIPVEHVRFYCYCRVHWSTGSRRVFCLAWLTTLHPKVTRLMDERYGNGCW